MGENRYERHTFTVADTPDPASVTPWPGAPDTGTAARTFTYLALEDLLDQPEPEYRFIVQDLLPVAGTSLLVAKPKVGKSTLARQLALAVAQGQPVLERAVQQGPVLYHAFEEKVTEVAQQIRLTKAPRSLPLHFHFGPAPEDPFWALEVALAEYAPSLVVIDTLAYWMRVQDFNDYGQVSQALQPLHRLARASGAHIMSVHHVGKGGVGPLGSTAFSGNVDTIMELSEVERDRVLETRQRYGEALPRTLLVFDQATATLSLGETVSGARQRDLEDDILAAIGSGQETEGALVVELQCRKDSMRLALDRLVARGLVLRRGTGRRGSPFHYGLATACVPSVRDDN